MAGSTSLLLPLMLATACCLLSALPASAEVGLSERPGNVHTLILTDCAKYQDWQTIAAAFAWRESGQPGKVTRIANCNEKDTKEYSKAMLDVVHTHMAPQYAWNERLKDYYAAYNKPGALVDWLNKTQVEEEYVLLLDSDMLLRRPFLPEEFNLTKGWVRAPYYSYLKGVHNELALKHIPDIAPRNDTLAGPEGRRADMVGGPYFMRTDDLRRLAPLWLAWTGTMRADMEAYKWAGDTGAGKGDRIWIAEMYGYAYGAAKSNLWHIWSHDFMLYPGYEIGAQMPRTIHYGLLWSVDDWSFDKHWYFDFNPHMCPPWNTSATRPKHGLFPAPPHPSTVKSAKGEYSKRYQDLVAIQTIALVNAALCDNYRKICPASIQLSTECDKAEKLYQDTKEAIADIEWVFDCTDHNHECPQWAKRGECEKSKQYMTARCKLACGFCTPKPPRKALPSHLPTSQATDKATSADATITGQSGGGQAGKDAAGSAMGKAGATGSLKDGVPTATDATAITLDHIVSAGKPAAIGASAAGHAALHGAQAAAQKAQEAAAGTKDAAAATIEAAKGADSDIGDSQQEQAAEAAHLAAKAAAAAAAGAAKAATAKAAAAAAAAKAGDAAAAGDTQQGHSLHPSAGDAQAAGADGSKAGSIVHGQQVVAADLQQAGQLMSDQQLRRRYPASSQTYAQLVQRCMRLADLDEAGLKVCIRTAGLRLQYPGTERLDASQTAAGKQWLAALTQDKRSQDTAGLGQTAGGEGTAALLEGQQRGVPQQQNMADLHAVYHTAGGKFENMLLQQKHSGASTPVVIICLVGLVGVVLLWRRRSRRGGSKVTHRNE